MQVTLWLSQGQRVMLYVVENEIQGKIVSIYCQFECQVLHCLLTVIIIHVTLIIYDVNNYYQCYQETKELLIVSLGTGQLK